MCVIAAWAKVIRKGYWEVELQGAKLGGKNLGITTKRAAIDTGSSLFAMPVEEADAINAKLGGKKNFAGQYTVDCNTIATLPVLTLTFGGKDFELTRGLLEKVPCFLTCRRKCSHPPLI